MWFSKELYIEFVSDDIRMTTNLFALVFFRISFVCFCMSCHILLYRCKIHKDKTYLWLLNGKRISYKKWFCLINITVLFFLFFFVNAQFNVLQRQKKLLKMSVWKTEKHDIAFSIYKPFDVRSYLDKQGGCVFCNKLRLLRAMCIISTSVSNITVLQSNETSHKIGLSI